MAIPVISPQAPNIRLPSDIMQRIAAMVQQQAQARQAQTSAGVAQQTALPLAQAQLQRTQEQAALETPLGKALLQQRLASAGLTKGQTSLIPARQALLQAQATKARSPFAGQKFIGPAGVAQSNILFKKQYADNPADLKELKDAQDALKRNANARYFLGIPSAERAQMIAKARTLGIDPARAVKLFSEGNSLQDLVDMSQAAKRPIPAEADITATPSNAHAETPATVNKSLADVSRDTKPLSFQDITPNFAPTEAVKTRAQFAAQASAGLDYLGKYVANNLNYGGITSKITRPWLQDAYSSNPIKQQKAVDYFVSQAIKPELALLRIKIQGGQPSARAMSVIEPTILGHINVDLANLPARIQSRVQAKAVEVLNEAAHQTELQTLSPNPNVYDPKLGPSQNISSAPAKADHGFTQEDFEFTAKKYGLTVAQVKQRAGIK